MVALLLYFIVEVLLCAPRVWFTTSIFLKGDEKKKI